MIKKASGITLVALVVTIIVLLILAGVSISLVLGNNGILTQASKAVLKTNEAKVQEQLEMEVASWTMEKYAGSGKSLGTSLDNTKYDVVDNGNGTYKVTDKETGYEFTVSDNGQVTSEGKTSSGTETNNTESLAVGEEASKNQTLQGAAATYQNPIIPKGFKAVNTTDASWTNSGGIITGWNNGLVIEDSVGNQFVWVPVDGTNVAYAKWTTNGISYSDTTDDTLPTGISSEGSQITKYGGFYVGRYEAGIPSNLGGSALTTASATQRNKSGYAPVVKENQIPWNYINYNNSKSNAEKMATEYGYDTNSVVTGLVTGTQWDTTMKWIENAGKNVQTDSTAWGNYYNNSKMLDIITTNNVSTNYGASWTTASSTTNNASNLIKTGASSETRVKNIYDLTGNLFEWTNEIYSSSRVNRGGSFSDISGDTEPAAFRNGLDPTNNSTYNPVGFRVILYVM